MNETTRRMLIRAFLDAPLSGPEIEARSMEIIDREAPAHSFAPDEWQIVRRMIHTAGDFGIMAAVRFSPDAVEAGIGALRGCRTIYTDANMIRSGISLARLKEVCGFYRRESIICHVAAEDVARKARRSGLPLPPRRAEGETAPGRGDHGHRERPYRPDGDQPDDQRGGAQAGARRRAAGRFRPRRGEQGRENSPRRLPYQIGRGSGLSHSHRPGGPPSRSRVHRLKPAVRSPSGPASSARTRRG